MAQLDQNLCYVEEKPKKKEWKDRERKREGKKEEMSSNVLQPNPPPTKKKKTIYVPRNTLLQHQPSPKHPSSSLSQNNVFFPIYVWAFWGLSWSEFHRENRTPRTFSLSLSTTLFPLYYLLSISVSFSLCLSHHLVLSFSLSPSLQVLESQPLLYIGSWVVFLCDLMMKKKMKGVALDASASYGGVYADPKARFKHHRLMQDYQHLHKETEAKKMKLLSMKQKKSTLLAEVRFLRRRYRYLLKNQSRNPPLERELVQPKKLETRSKSVTKERNYSGKEAALRNPAPVFDLNQKGRYYNGKTAALRNPAPVFDLNQRERIHSGKEAILRNPAPVFDLNQISREEEEFQVNCEPMRIEEPKKCLIRGASDEQHNDVKLSVCRNIGNGSSRAGKRKISWQDQVALRV